MDVTSPLFQRERSVIRNFLSRRTEVSSPLVACKLQQTSAPAGHESIPAALGRDSASRGYILAVHRVNAVLIEPSTRLRLCQLLRSWHVAAWTYYAVAPPQDTKAVEPFKSSGLGQLTCSLISERLWSKHGACVLGTSETAFLEELDCPLQAPICKHLSKLSKMC